MILALVKCGAEKAKAKEFAKWKSQGRKLCVVITKLCDRR
jgi:hypothetical protein